MMTEKGSTLMVLKKVFDDGTKKLKIHSTKKALAYLKSSWFLLQFFLISL